MAMGVYRVGECPRIRGLVGAPTSPLGTNGLVIDATRCSHCWSLSTPPAKAPSGAPSTD